MISGKTIICFASGYDYHPTSKHHVMRRLAEHNQVVWVNWHASRRPRAHLTDLRAIGVRLAQMRRGPQRAAESLTVLTPCQLPFPGSNLARRLNVRMTRRAIGKVLAGLPRRPIQVWCFAPDVGDLAGAFGEELLLYYCVDAFGEFPGYDRALIERREGELIARSDVVITTSPPLYEAKRRLHPNVHLVQHGVDHERLSRGLREPLECPADLAGLPRPIFGFVGMIGEWVDLDLVAGLARMRPDASLVMIGPELVGRGPCAGLPNVHFLGARNHELLPGYLSRFDVGLIPFRQVPLTYHANPIKLYEYLAAGVPVVSNPLPAVEPMADAVWLADELAEWAVCCARASRRNEPAMRRARSERMKAHSWTARLEQLSRIVEDALDGPQGDGLWHDETSRRGQRRPLPVTTASQRPSVP
ncbi:MAG: glycosyltransferase [Phycisphaerae bacterium]|jgi:glycosyltransferase involved in cell wall biosynthesis